MPPLPLLLDAVPTAKPSKATPPPTVTVASVSSNDHRKEAWLDGDEATAWQSNGSAGQHWALFELSHKVPKPTPRPGTRILSFALVLLRRR